MITGWRELYDHVMNDYKGNCVELNSCFFDLDVRMQKAEILLAYIYLQSDINGDRICIAQDGKYENVTWITLRKMPELKEVYEGNCKEFLESFNGKHLFYRIIEEEVDFIL